MAAYATIGVRGKQLADRADASVHHVARRDGVGAGLDVADGRAREQLDRRVVRDLAVPITPQCPCAVYSHRQTSVTRTSSGMLGPDRAQRPLDDPSSSQAPEPRRPSPRDAEEEQRLAAERRELARLARRVSTESGSSPAAPRSGPSTGRRSSGMTKSSRSSRVSRTSPRKASVRRSRRRRVAGKALTGEGYVRRTPCSGVRPCAFVSYGRDRAWLVEGFGRVGYGAAHGFGPKPPRGAPACTQRAGPQRAGAPARPQTAARAARHAISRDRIPFGGAAANPAADRVRHLDVDTGRSAAHGFAERAPGRPADPADHCHGRRGADPASGRPERRHGARLPPRRRRLARARPGRAPGERRAPGTALEPARRH